MPYTRIEFRKESTQEWVGVAQRDPTDEDGLRLIGAGPTGVLEVIYADIPGNSWNQNRLNKFAEIANQRLTLRIPLTDLPIDDPDRTTDPNQFPWLYWNAGDLCSQAIVVSDVTYSASAGLRFTVTDARLLI